MKRWHRDLILILVIVIVAVVTAFFYFSLRSEGACISVIKNGETIAVYPIDENMTVPITDGNNTNILVVENGRVYISQATCPDKICVNHRPVSKTGDTIVCLPAKLVIEIGK